MLCFRLIRRSLYQPQFLSSGLRESSNTKRNNDVQIVVIGAGLAGLSAANHLLKHGFQRTILLEASDRLGGRVSSKLFGDAFCELGAKWVTIDATKNSVYELLQQAMVAKKIQQRKEVFYLTSAGEQINQGIPELVEELYKRLSSGIALKEKYKANSELNDLNNVQTYFEAETSKIVTTLFKKRDQSIASDIFHSLCNEFGSLFGCCLEYMNIEHIVKKRQHGEVPVYIPTGLDNVLNHITSNIDTEHMKVGKPVGEIKWYGSTRLDQKSVGCLDGSLFNADHIICTLPLGVLKTFAGYIFKPTLPREKQQAIRNLGFGSPVKIYFEYAKDIKPWFRVNIRPLWSTKEKNTDLMWTKQVVEISKLPASRRVLEIQIGGQFFHEIEKLPDVELLEKVTSLLRTFLKNPKIPYPTSMLRSNWSSCACYLGGRPYFSTESSPADVATLGAPLGDTPSLLFAGDATILHGFGTVDGARMSGIREAQRIVELYKKPG